MPGTHFREATEGTTSHATTGTPAGTNTPNAIQSGLVFGYVAMVEGMVARFRRELGDDLVVVGTGGLVDVVAQETTSIDHVDRTLTLKGLRLVYQRNVEGSDV